MSGFNQYGAPYNYGYGFTAPPAGGFVGPQNPQAPQPQPQAPVVIYGMNWVQGEAGASAAQVSPGCVAVLFDSTRQVFYVKSVDQNGKPQPLEEYDYSKHEEQAADMPDMSQYVTKAELQELLKGGSTGGKSK